MAGTIKGRERFFYWLQKLILHSYDAINGKKSEERKSEPFRDLSVTISEVVFFVQHAKLSSA